MAKESSTSRANRANVRQNARIKSSAKVADSRVKNAHIRQKSSVKSLDSKKLESSTFDRLERQSVAFFTALCENIGENAKREGLKLTPKRIAKSFSECLSGYDKSAREALGSVFIDGACDEMIVLKQLPFYSICEHHLLPFFGRLSIGYIPNSRIVGISGLARLAEVFSQRLQIQEQLTAQIADALMDELKPKGVMVVCEARHLCLEMRGKQRQSEIITSALRGGFKKDPKTRAEFMQILKS